MGVDHLRSWGGAELLGLLRTALESFHALPAAPGTWRARPRTGLCGRASWQAVPAFTPGRMAREGIAGFLNFGIFGLRWGHLPMVWETFPDAWEPELTPPVSQCRNF